MKKRKADSPARIDPKTAIQPDWLGIIEELKLTVTPSMGGGWSGWTEIEGRENTVIVVRGHERTLKGLLLNFQRRSKNW